MTVETETSRVAHTGAGTTGPFTIPFYFIADEDIRAIKVTIADGTETELTLTTHFTLTGAGDENGGELTLVDSLSSSFKLVIFRDPALLQESDYTPNDRFPSETHERVADRATMIAQRNRELADRSMKQPDGDGTLDMELPAAVERASKYLAFNASGEPIASDPLDGLVTDADQVQFAASGSGAVSTTVQDELRYFVRPEQFGGGVSKTAAENKTAIDAAVTKLAATGGDVLFEGLGTYSSNALAAITSDGIFLKGNGKSALSFAADTGTFITFSAASGSRRLECGIIDLPITKTLNWGTQGTQADSDSIGVLLQNCQRFLWRGMNVTNFYTGVRLYGLGQGCVYNRFDVVGMRSNKIQVEFLNASSGWTNENTLYGGNWTTTDTGDSGTRHLKVFSAAGAGFCDGNNIIGGSFEGGPAIGAEIGSGVTNLRFGFTRHEHSGSTPCVDSTGTNVSFSHAQFAATGTDVIVRSGAGRHRFNDCGTFQYEDENVPSVVYGGDNATTSQAVKSTNSSINLLPDGSAENLVTSPLVSTNSLGVLMPGWEWSYSNFNTGVVGTAETSEKKHGAQSLKLVNTGAQNFRFGFKITGLDTTAPVVIKFALKCSAISSNAIRVRVGSTLSLNEDLNSPITPDDDWHEYEYKVTPTGADRYVYLYFDTSSAFTAYFDGATVTIGDDAPPAYLPAAVTERGGTVLGTLKATTNSVRGDNGQLTTGTMATVSVSTPSGATVTATNLIPAGSLVLGVTARVTTLITGATSFAIGDGSDADRWGTGIAVALNTTTGIANFTITSPVYYAAATSVVLTAAGSDFTAGAVRLTVHYISLTAPTNNG